MQPAQAGDSGAPSNRALKRWGPILAVLAVIIVGIVVISTTGGGDSDDEAVATTIAPTTTIGDGATTSTAPDDTTPSGEITFPLSFSQAQEQGVVDQIDWGTRCDTSVGRVAVPDFFAPECFAPFTGDNGGATDVGVTADEITLVYYAGQENDPIIDYITSAVAVDDTNEQLFETMRGLVKYYETYYELYGRKINLVTFTGTGGAADDVAARADAALIAEQYQPFAVLGGPALTSAFSDELAAREITCIGCGPGQPGSWYEDRDPYLWGLDASAEQKRTHVVEFITKQLVGKNAEHAGEALKSTPRKFGYVYIDSGSGSKDLADGYAAAMEAAGAPFAEVLPYELNPGTIQDTASQVISKLKSAGVTTIVFSGDPVAPRDFTREATAQEYFPEWVVAASTLVDVNAFARTYDQEQWKHAFGVTSLAAKSDPTVIGAGVVYEWFTGSPPPAPGSIGVISPNPALFFAVVQGVGPNLTSETWRDGLFEGTGTQKAISQPYLSYGDKGLWPDTDYQGVDDATAFWWDPTTVGPDELRRSGPGMYQFVDGGKRYLPGEWPTEEKLFNPEGAVAIYTTPPPGEAPRDYPSPAG
ncbi:MAG: hypothetical protein ACOYL9_09125 [Ilumatobacteraceae bacterium]